MKKLLIGLSIVLVFLTCNTEPMETNPFVGTWERIPEGGTQYVFFNDGKFEYRDFRPNFEDNYNPEYRLQTHYFGTYVYEDNQAIINFDHAGSNPIVFYLDHPLFRKTNNPLIKEWAPFIDYDLP